MEARDMFETATGEATEERSRVQTELATTAINAKEERPVDGAGIEREAKRFAMRDVNLYYGDFHAVEGVTVEIEPNKVTALIGSSGCGKTTVLRSLNRMHELTPGARVEGKVILDGEDIYAPDVDPVE